MYRLTLSDGTAFDAVFCAARGDVLTLSIRTALTFMEVAQAFGDPLKTGVITFIYGEMQDVHRDFTGLFMINGPTPGEYMISLRRTNE